LLGIAPGLAAAVAAAAAAAPHNRKDRSLGSRAGAAAPFTVSRGSGQALQHAEAMDNPSLSVPEVSLQGMLSEDTDSEPSSEEWDGTSPPCRRGRPPGKGRPAVHRRSILSSADTAPGRAPGTVRTPPYSIYVCRGYVVASSFWQVLRYTPAYIALPPSPNCNSKCHGTSAGIARAPPRVSLSSSRATGTYAVTAAGQQAHGSRTIEGAATVCIEVANPQADLIVPPALMQVCRQHCCGKVAAAQGWKPHPPCIDHLSAGCAHVRHDGGELYTQSIVVLLQVLYGNHWPPQQPAIMSPYGDVVLMMLQEQPGPIR
jgi:hypothetical protein